MTNFDPREPSPLSDRVAEIFERALMMRGEERVVYLEEACAGEPVLQAELLSLLKAHEAAQSFLSDQTEEGDDAGALRTNSAPMGGSPMDAIDRYRLEVAIGEGGFGSVYRAEQLEPVRRQVAVKVIKLGMDTRQVIARFEAERQALAMMDHPAIAKVFDAGATRAGRPYFAMELVAGEPITHYCDAHRLNTRQRLELFSQVCGAIQHAHQKGIIHRDIKPSNVLVSAQDGTATPKVIDFGIAKATEAELTTRTIFTEQRQMIGTPTYMSPEQAGSAGTDIDTRSDIYSLGVLLYELLTGVTPFDTTRLLRVSLEELVRIIREEEPSRPSTRLSTLGDAEPGIAERRDTDVRRLRMSLRGDLDWIVMKGLEKDRSRRYSTASALADDIQRFLHDEPVVARPPSVRYQMHKLVRRHRGAVAAGAAIVLVLIAATAVSLAFALSANRQRQTAVTALARAEKAERGTKARAEELEQVARFQEEQLSRINPQTMGVKLRTDLVAKARAAAERWGRTPEEIDARIKQLEDGVAGIDLTGMALTALDENVFQTALRAIEVQFGGKPEIKAQLLQSVASTQRELGLLDAATQPQEQAVAIRRRVLGDDHPDTLVSLCNMGQLLVAQGKLAEAEPYFHQTLQGFRLVLGDEHPETLRSIANLGGVLQKQGKLKEAEAHYREAMEKLRRVLGDENADTLSTISNLGLLLQEQNRLSEAEPYWSEALRTRRHVLGDEHPATLTSLHHMALLLHAQGKLKEAEAYFRESLEKHRRVLGDDHPNTLAAIMSMGVVLRSQGRLEEVGAFYHEALEKERRLLGDEHPDTITTIHNMGFLLQAQGKLAEAEPYCREAMEKWRRLLGDEHPDTLIAINTLGLVLLAQGRLSEAEPFCREAMESRRRVRGEEHFDTLVSISNMGKLLQAQSKPAEAIALMAPVEHAARREFRGNPVRLGRFLTALGRARAAGGEFDTAETILIEAYVILSDAQGAIDRDRGDVLSGLAELYDARHATEPDKGYEAKAAEWRAKLQQLNPETSQSSK